MTTRTAAVSPAVKPSKSSPTRASGRTSPGPVLLALHGQEMSDAAGLAAYLLADRMRTGAKIVSVIEPVPTVTGPDGMPMVATVLPETGEAREEAVLRRLSLVPTHERKCEIEVRYGQVAPEIARAADEAGASVIVVDAAPHRRLRHTVSGRCAAHVLRRTHTPVLSVAPAFAALPRRAIAAIDFSPASVAAARVAVRMLAENGVLTLLHIAPELDHGRMVVGATEDRIMASVNRALEQLREELLPLAMHGTVIRTKITMGVVVSEILSAADELEAELIAVGTHGPGLVERFFVGSVAGTVLELAGTTVLAAPAPGMDVAAGMEPTSLSEEPAPGGRGSMNSASATSAGLSPSKWTIPRSARRSRPVGTCCRARSAIPRTTASRSCWARHPVGTHISREGSGTSPPSPSARTCGAATRRSRSVTATAGRW